MTAGIAVIPAVGFDVVPSDCLAAMLAAVLPAADHLQLAFTIGPISRGTAKTILETLPRGGRARIDGRIRWVPIAWKTIRVPFLDGKKWAVSIPWGDVASAYYSTGIPNVEVYVALPRSQIRRLRRWRWFFPLLRFGPVRKLLQNIIESRVTGPSVAQREREHAALWGRVSDSDGNSAEATLLVPSGYQLTVLTSLAAVDRVLSSSAPPGFSTPSRAFGKEFILGMPEAQMIWLDRPRHRATPG